jgi:Xaa-Pro aminopeptidase
MFSMEILRARMARAHAALKEFDVDLWISIGRETHLTCEPALLYLTPAPVILPCAMLISPDRSVILSAKLDFEEMQSYGAADDVIAHDGDIYAALEKVIKGFAGLKRVALNFSQSDSSADGLSLTQYLRITCALKSAGFEGELISSQPIMQRVRAQKSGAELDYTERTVKAAMRIYEGARNVIRSGMSGADIQRYFQEQVKALDAGYSWPKMWNPYVSIGARSSYMCKRPPNDVFVQPGDLINVDFGLQIDGFASDNQRSYYVLEKGQTQAADEVQRAFEAVQAAERAAVSVIAPGVHTLAARDAANAVFHKLGYPPVGGLGHELGSFAHEGGIRLGSVYQVYAPCNGGILTTSLSETGCEEPNYILKEGMTFTMEPAILTSRGRLCQEEVVAVTKDGCRMLSTPQSEVWLVQ